MSKMPPHRRVPAGMTIIELLVVISIMLVLLVLAANSFQSLGRTSEVTTSIQAVADTLNLARQIAVSRNAYTQVRFLAPPVSGTDFRRGQFTTLAIYRADSPYYTNASGYNQLTGAGKMVQEGRLTRLPESCIIVSNTPYSPLLQTLDTDSKYKLSGITLPEGSSDGLAFYFKPDGSMDIPNVNTITALSICAMQAFKAAGDKLPPNYGIISLDPLSGRYQIVRP